MRDTLLAYQRKRSLCFSLTLIDTHLQVNVNGPLVLFQTTYSLLKESKDPKFVSISTGLGSIHRGAAVSARVYAYGASKAALNWVTRKLHHDFPDFSESSAASTRTQMLPPLQCLYSS